MVRTGRARLGVAVGIVAALVVSSSLAASTAPARTPRGAPANDGVGGAERIRSLPYVNAQDISQATASGYDGYCAGNASYDAKTVWYRYTPREDVNVYATTDGSLYDTTLSVYTLGAGQLDCNDDDNNNVAGNNYSSELYLSLQSGRAYYFMIGSYYDQLPNADCDCPSAGVPWLVFSIEELAP